MEELINTGSVVQINESGQQGWVGCYVTVTELKTWGIQGFVQIPMQEGQAYIRLKTGEYDYIGEAALTIQ